MTKTENIKKDIANIDLKIQKLQAQRNLLILSYNSIVTKKKELVEQDFSTKTSNILEKSSTFGK